MPNDADTLTEAQSAVRARESTYRASDGCELHVIEWASSDPDWNPSVVVVVVHGYAEYSARYADLAHQLVRQGYLVTGMDARGHGQSPGQRGHIATYERYIDDLYEFVQALHKRHSTCGLVVLGHSHGGLTALRMVQSRPALIDALVLSSPLVELQPSQQPVPFWFARLLSRFVGALPLPSGLKSSDLTHDRVIMEKHARDPLIHKRSTPRWYVSAMRTMRAAMNDVTRVTLPVLVIVAEKDRIVRPDGVKRMFQGLASTDKELVVCPGAFHEVLNEIDRAKLFGTIGRWLSSRVGSKAA